MAGKSKKALQDESLQGDSPAQVQEAQSAAAEPAAEAAEPVRLVLLAHPGTGAIVERIWKKFCPGAVLVIPYVGSESLVSVLENLVADVNVDRNFVLIPANLVPLCPVSWEELQLLRVYVNGDGSKIFWGRVPVRFDKDALADFLPDNAELDGEALVQKYQETFIRTRAEAVGHTFGNYIFNVLRGTPCEHLVIEGILSRRFCYANVTGWDAIENLLTKALL